MATLKFISIEVNPDDLAQVQWMLASVKNGAETAVMRAANDTAVTARSRIVDTVYSRLNLKKARIREETDVLKANFGSLAATALIFQRPILAAEFPYITSFLGVSHAMRKNEPDELFRHRFEAKMPSGHIGVFERRLVNGRPVKRLPIDEAKGPHIGNVFHYNDEQKVFSDMMELFGKNLLARADYILSQAK